LRNYAELVGFGLLLLLSAGAHAQESETGLTVYAGVVKYNNPEYDSVALVEFPFSVNRHEFEFYRPDSADTNLYARIFAQINLFDSSGLPIDSTNTIFSVRAATREEAEQKNYRLFNRLVLFAKPGSYSARLTAIDVVSKRKGEFFLGKFDVEPIEKERISLGGLCPAYSLRYVGEDTAGSNVRLTKNGFEIIANPLSVFSTNDSLIHLYGEVYNLAYSVDVSSEYQLSFSAWDAKDDLFRDFGSMALTKPGGTAVMAESFDIKGWSPGAYRLQVVVLDQTTGGCDTAQVRFQIVSPEEIRLAVSRTKESDPYDTLSLKVKVNLVTYLLTPDQKAMLDRLNDNGKLNFLDQYWREHDDKPSTKVIENRLELIERYVYCNRRFSTNADKTDGWATPRGRIYMTYGPCDELDDRLAPLLGNPYQIWYYRGVKEGKFFVFEDWTGTGDYRLVHSNVHGEIYSQDWQDRIDEGLSDLPIEH
jgi:GWxTD domain-containing protein